VEERENGELPMAGRSSGNDEGRAGYRIAWLASRWRDRRLETPQQTAHHALSFRPQAYEVS
jgi:hypothetical protein